MSLSVSNHLFSSLCFGTWHPKDYRKTKHYSNTHPEPQPRPHTHTHTHTHIHTHTRQKFCYTLWQICIINKSVTTQSSLYHKQMSDHIKLSVSQTSSAHNAPCTWWFSVTLHLAHAISRFTLCCSHGDSWRQIYRCTWCIHSAVITSLFSAAAYVDDEAI